MYLPLIGKPPSDPETMATALHTAKKVSEGGVGQVFVIFTVNQQLYRVALQIIWQDPKTFSNTYLRLGGMHLLMSFCSCIGTLMAETGIIEILSVLKMLVGKKYPDNVRPLHMLTEELLHPIFDKHTINSMADLQDSLDNVSKRSKTA